MNIKKVSGFVAVAALLVIAAPGERAQAASLIGPGVATAVQDNTVVGNTTEVRWHRGWRRYGGWHRRWHRGWRRW